MHDAVISPEKVEKPPVEKKAKEKVASKEDIEENLDETIVGGLKKNGQPLRVNMDTPRQGREILVVQGSSAYNLESWCGSSALVISSDKTGLELVDFNGKRTVLEAKNTYGFNGCTPDGKWVFFYDWNSRRIDKGRQVPEKDYGGEGGGWQGFVVDLYRYEVATGKRQKFAVVRDVGCMSSKVSPDGSKILLGCRHNSIIEMPEPKWEAVWLSTEWPLYDMRWFTDSSGIATVMVNNGYYLGLEVFGDEGWIGGLHLKNKAEYAYSLAMVDEGKVFYFLGSDGLWKYNREVSNITYYYRCEMKGKELSCEAIARLQEDRIGPYLAFLPSGAIIFMSKEDNCIARLRPGADEAECVVDMKDIGDDYDGIYLANNAVSPDGRWVVFTVGTNELVRIDETMSTYRQDLFVKELVN